MSKKSKNKKSKNKFRQPSFIKNSKPKVPAPVQTRIIAREVQEDIEESTRIIEEFKKKVRDDNTRQIIKIMCLSLHEKYGFGKMRAATLIGWMTDLINEELEANDNDKGDFWYRIDKELESLEMNFFPSEDEIHKKEGTFKL